MAGTYKSKYPTEKGALEDIATVVNDPYGSWATMQRYYNQASDIQKYIDTVNRDIEEAKSQPGYKSSKELQDYVSGLLNTIKKIREQPGSNSVATPGINPNASSANSGENVSWNDWAENLYKDTITGDIVKAGREAAGIPEKGATGITDWITDNLQNMGFIVLGIAVIGIAFTMTAKKQVLQVVKGAAAEIITG